MDPAKTCPLCRAPLRGLARYGRALNKQLLGGAQRKFLAATSEGLRRAEASLVDLQARVQQAAAAAGAGAGGGGASRGQLGALLRQGRAVRQQFYSIGTEAGSGNPGMRVYFAAR